MTYAYIDIEASGLFPVPGSKIFCITVNYKGKIVVHENNFHLLRSLFEDPNICKVIHNAGYDCFWLKVLLGWDVRNVWDTFLMEQVINGDNLPLTDA